MFVPGWQCHHYTEAFRWKLHVNLLCDIRVLLPLLDRICSIDKDSSLLPVTPWCEKICNCIGTYFRKSSRLKFCQQGFFFLFPHVPYTSYDSNHQMGNLVTKGDIQHCTEYSIGETDRTWNGVVEFGGFVCTWGTSWLDGIWCRISDDLFQSQLFDGMFSLFLILPYLGWKFVLAKIMEKEYSIVSFLMFLFIQFYFIEKSVLFFFQF